MTREGLISVDARALYELLGKYPGNDRIFALSEITRLVQARLATRESSRYSLDLSRDRIRVTDPDRLDSIDTEKTTKE